MDAYFSLLQKWNLRVSLTSLSIQDASADAIDRLLIEPLLAVKHLPTSARVLIDVGSGGGSPAIPLKIVRPDLLLTMVESKTRKAAFLREVIRQLSLANTEVENSRLEALLNQPKFSNSADAISIRAVRIEAKLLTTVQRLLKPDGRVLLFQSMTSGKGNAMPFVVEATRRILPALGSEVMVLRNP